MTGLTVNYKLLLIFLMINYTIKRPITILRDDLIVAQLPKKVLKQLGTDVIESGFHLGEGRRDLFFENGSASYKLGSNSISVVID